MRGLMAVAGMLLGATVILGVAATAQAKDTQEYTAGQWTGYSYTNDDNGQFTDCTVWAANRDDVSIGVSVLKDWSLQLWLYAKSWDLPLNQSYPVSYWVDRNQLYRGKASVTGKTNVRVDVDQDNDVFQELKAGSELTIRTSSDDYVFDLAGSRSALSQLVDCVDHYSKVATSNPFGAGSGDAQQNGGGQQQDQSQQNQQQSSQQQSNQQQNNNGSQQNGSNEEVLKNLTVSSDEVHGFLVDVTGAKPAMISVTPKSSKAGDPYYVFDTPLGGGEFWQEKRTGGALQDIAISYLDDYLSDCKGADDQNPNKPVSGDHGELVTGTAYCEKSPYQKDDGPEFMSYSMAEIEGVVSIYITYTGGNAAKAKSDSLGRLIAKRAEGMVK